MKLEVAFGDNTHHEKVKKELLDRFGVNTLHEINRDEIFESTSSSSRYSTRTHSGKLKEGVELTELELAMILDGGYYWFGGDSTIYDNGSFRVNIYTD